MAANTKEFIDILSPSALSDLAKGIKSTKDLVKEINKAVVAQGQLNSGGNSPSSSSANTAANNRAQQQANDLLRQQIRLLNTIATATRQTQVANTQNTASIERQSQARATNNQRSAEEIVNQRLLAANANRAAMANSTFANSYERLSAQQNISARRVQDIIARGRTAEQTQRQYNRELRNAEREFATLNQRVLAADRAVGRFNRNVGNYPMQAVSGLTSLLGAFGVVGGVTAFAAITKDIFNTTREIQSLDLALSQVIGNSNEFAQTQAFLQQVSDDYGIEINGLTKSYTGFLAASQNAIEAGAITAEQIQDIFASVSKASGAMGLSVEQQQGAFLALQQMISKGTVQAEEIRGQLAERLPGAFGILAKSMGVTEQQLGKLLKDGKVLAAEVLPAFAKELEKAYGVENLNRVESLTAETTRLSNAWTNFIRTLNEGDGAVSSFFGKFISFTTKALQGLDELFKSEKQRQDELEKGNENDAYTKQIEMLKEYAKASTDFRKTEAENAEITEKNRKQALVSAEDDYNQSIKMLAKLRKERAALEPVLNKRNSTGEFYATGEEKSFTNSSDANKKLVLDAEKRIEQLYLLTKRYQGVLSASKDYLDDNTVRVEENSKRTVEAIEAEIAAEEKRLKLTTKRSEAQPIQTRIAELEEEKIAILGDKAAKKARQKSMKESVDYLKEVYQLQKQATENWIEEESRIMNDEEKNYDKRLEASNNYYFQKQVLLDLELKEAIRVADLEYSNQTAQYKKSIADGTATLQQLAGLEYQHTIKKKRINEQYENDNYKLRIESAKKLQGVLDGIQDQQSRNTINEGSVTDSISKGSYYSKMIGTDSLKGFVELDNQLKKLQDQEAEREKGLLQIDLDRVQANKSRLEIENEGGINNSAIAELKKEELNLQNQLLAVDNKRLEALANIKREIKESTAEYLKGFTGKNFDDTGFKSIISLFDEVSYTTADGIEKVGSSFEKLFDQAETFGEKFAVVFNTVTTIASEAFDFASQNQQAKFDAQYAALEKQYELDQEFNAKGEEAKAELQKQYDERRREIRIKEAKAEKENAIFKAIINTAQGVTSALATANIPLSIIIAALGAAQVASIAGRQIPAYEFGTANHPGGLAWVGDGGRSEIINQPNSGWSVSPSVPTLMNLERGTQVFPDANAFRREIPASIGGGGMNIDYDRLGAAVGRNVPAAFGANFDKKGITTWAGNASTRTINHNNRISSVGRKI